MTFSGRPRPPLPFAFRRGFPVAVFTILICGGNILVTAENATSPAAPENNQTVSDNSTNVTGSTAGPNKTTNATTNATTYATEAPSSSPTSPNSSSGATNSSSASNGTLANFTYEWLSFNSSNWSSNSSGLSTSSTLSNLSNAINESNASNNSDGILAPAPAADSSKPTGLLDVSGVEACTGDNYADCVEPCESTEATCARKEFKGSMSTYFTPEGLDTDAWKTAPFYACCRHPLRLQCAESSDVVAPTRVCEEDPDTKEMVCPMVGACQKTCRCVVRKPTQCRAGDNFFGNMAKCGPMTGLGCERGHASTGNDPPLYIVVEGYYQNPFKSRQANNAASLSQGAPTPLCNHTLPMPGGSEPSAAATAGGTAAVASAGDPGATGDAGTLGPSATHDNIECNLRVPGKALSDTYLAARKDAHLMVSVFAPCFQKGGTLGGNASHAVARCYMKNDFGTERRNLVNEAVLGGLEVTIDADRYEQGTLAHTRIVGNAVSCQMKPIQNARNKIRIIINAGEGLVPLAHVCILAAVAALLVSMTGRA